MKAIEKFRSMSKMDAIVMVTLVAVAIGCFALTAYGIKMILSGNLFAVIWSIFTAGGACIVSEEAQRVWEAQDVKVNH